MKISIVVPVYNEVDNLEPLHFALSDVLRRQNAAYEILLVDDGSTDGSLELAERLAEQDPRVRVVELARNFGQTAALDAGLRLATGDVIVTLDADLQNEPADIPRLLEKLDEGFDLVYGWRKNRHDRWWSRRLPSRIANELIRRVTGFPAHDIGCTLKAMRRETAGRLKLYGEMHRFIPILAHAQGARCAEIVAQHHPRRRGQTKYGLGRTLRVAVDLLLVQFLTRYAACPMRLLGPLGAAGLAAAAVAASAALLSGAWLGLGLAAAALGVLAAVAAVGGIQLLGLGLVAELLMRSYFESRDERPYTIRRATPAAGALESQPAAIRPRAERQAA